MHVGRIDTERNRNRNTFARFYCLGNFISSNNNLRRIFCLRRMSLRVFTDISQQIIKQCRDIPDVDNTIFNHIRRHQRRTLKGDLFDNIFEYHKSIKCTDHAVAVHIAFRRFRRSCHGDILLNDVRLKIIAAVCHAVARLHLGHDEIQRCAVRKTVQHLERQRKDRAACRRALGGRRRKRKLRQTCYGNSKCPHRAALDDLRVHTLKIGVVHVVPHLLDFQRRGIILDPDLTVYHIMVFRHRHIDRDGVTDRRLADRYQRIRNGRRCVLCRYRARHRAEHRQQHRQTQQQAEQLRFHRDSSLHIERGLAHTVYFPKIYLLQFSIIALTHKNASKVQNSS